MGWNLFGSGKKNEKQPISTQEAGGASDDVTKNGDELTEEGKIQKALEAVATFSGKVSDVYISGRDEVSVDLGMIEGVEVNDNGEANEKGKNVWNSVQSIIEVEGGRLKSLTVGNEIISDPDW